MSGPGSRFAATVDAKLNDMGALFCKAHGELHGVRLHLDDTLRLYRIDLASEDQKDYAEAQFDRAMQELERLGTEQRSYMLAVIHSAGNKFNQQYQALQHENERLQQRVMALSPPSPASKVTLPLPGVVSVCQHLITESCAENRDPIACRETNHQTLKSVTSKVATVQTQMQIQLTLTQLRKSDYQILEVNEVIISAST